MRTIHTDLSARTADHCILLPSQDHFSIIRPTLTFIAEKINADVGTGSSITITHAELNARVNK